MDPWRTRKRDFTGRRGDWESLLKRATIRAARSSDRQRRSFHSETGRRGGPRGRKRQAHRPADAPGSTRTSEAIAADHGDVSSRGHGARRARSARTAHACVSDLQVLPVSPSPRETFGPLRTDQPMQLERSPLENRSPSPCLTVKYGLVEHGVVPGPSGGAIRLVSRTRADCSKLPRIGAKLVRSSGPSRSDARGERAAWADASVT